jgi:twitching motility two-component system response regulator PilG
MRLELDQPPTPYPLQDSVQSNPQTFSDDITEIVKRGIEAARSGNRSQARILLKHAVEREPGSELAWLWLASISEYPEELLVFLDHVLLINPSNRRAVEWKAATEILLAKTFVQRGIDAASEGRKEQAIEWFNEALKRDEKNEAATYWLASLTEVPEPQVEHTSSSAHEVLEPNTESSKYEHSDVPAPDLYTPPRSESVVLRPLMTYNRESEDGPTQELVLPESLLESNPFESFAEEIPPPAESLPLPFVPDAQPEVHCYEEPTIVEDVEVQAESWVGDSFVPQADEDCDIQEVLAAASFEEVEEPTVHLAELEENESQPQDWFAPVSASAHDDVINIVEHFCPFCKSDVGDAAIFCSSCEAMLTLSDIDAILSHTPSDPTKLRQAVQSFEELRESGNLSGESLQNLAIGYLNLGEMDVALSCLQEASAADPNNVMISSELNTLAIRIDEIRNHEERFPSIPTGKRILVVDDSPTIRKLISGKLEKGGHEVYCAEDGVQAVDLLKNLTPDLILLDITMPNMDGYQVCKSIRAGEKTKNVPVVMISGKDGFFDKVRGKMAGSTDYITKPFGPEALMKALGKYLHDDLVETETQNDLD